MTENLPDAPAGSLSSPSERAVARRSGAGDAPVERGRLAVILFVLTLVNVVNFMDRSLLPVLAESIKREFALSDTQLGVLSGMAFAVVYGLLALPIALIADRGLYRPVIMVSLTAWSVLTTLGGLSQSFVQLAMMRVGVAAGEAGLNPAAHALISRLWPAQRRGSVIALFSLGVPVGAAAGAILAGVIAQAHGWRAAFFVIGPMGLAMIPLLLVLPKFRPAPAARNLAGLREALGLMRLPAFRNVWIGCALASMFSFSVVAFLGPFYIRIHGMTVAQAGAALGVMAILGNALGALAGGLVFDAVKRRRPGYELYPSALSLMLAALASLSAWLTADTSLSFAALVSAMFLYGMSTVPGVTIGQNLAPENQRAGASALMGISTGLVGATGGPLLVGYLSDIFGASAGPRGLTYALCSTALALLGGAAAYFLAGRNLVRNARA